MHVQNTRTMRSRRVALSVAAVLLSATGLLVALLAPGRVSAAQHDANAERAAKPIAPSAAAVTKHVDSGMPLDEGTTLLPASGDTQLPATPDTPRPHYVRPPAHLP
ncbi:hypothetical protein SBC1_58890 (plasmid) [Caballeronia sp. SBC1]|uniref:hypothetical protein n=1 Tax=unclassified Caballeronia TaxID=2646786 RepID=UPI0013E14268|nr:MULTISPECIES: hypothetical protein [unclassified Caballeronia]QIE27778.1 hypothetical protein SBC2_58530 [Caballeronia sp. SBC2]QIN65843.1 hypothetical protein SBC1_58890 [Caballeronia sp. SBC1]